MNLTLQKTLVYSYFFTQTEAFESLSEGNVGCGTNATSSAELGLARFHKLVIMSNELTWLARNILTSLGRLVSLLETPLLLDNCWRSSDQLIKSRKSVSLILCAITGSISAGSPRSAHVTRAKYSGDISAFARSQQNLSE